MIPGLGAYYRPDRLEAALALLAQEPDCEILAGGTDLLLGATPRRTLVDIMHLGLGTLRESDDGLHLGGALTVQDLLESDAAARWADGVLRGACLEFGTLQIRNMATVGGNIAHALPAADLVPALLVLDAELHLARHGTDGVVRRTLPLDGFATAPFRTRLEPGELLVEIRLPAASRHLRAQFRKIGRVQKDLAQVNCAVALDVQGDAVRGARIALGAVHPTVVRVPGAEAELRRADVRGGDWPARVDRAVDAVRAFVQPIDDLRASRAWRLHVAGVLVRRCLAHVADPATRGRVPKLEDGPSYCAGLRLEEPA